ncbi:MAG: efflux RND transporter permease subunit [Desulfuromonadaceae bacterium]|nr:efflux RND transporter permease subunit [Desulfuromonadaceae bacterium]
MEHLGLAGRIAKRSIDSPLVPLFVIACFIFGIYSLMVIPREDRPDIDIPTASVIIPWPGAGAEQIDNQLARRGATWVRRLANVTEVRSSSTDDATLLQVEFTPGTNQALAFARLEEVFSTHAHLLPQGAGPAQIETYGDDHLVMLSASLSSKTRSAIELELLATEVATELEQIEGVRNIRVYGGNQRAIEILPDIQSLAAHNLTLSDIADAIGIATRQFPVGRLESAPVTLIRAGSHIGRIETLARIPVGRGDSGPIYLEDVATIRDGSVKTHDAALYWHQGQDEAWPSVTIAATTLDGRNVSDITRALNEHMHQYAVSQLPADVKLSTTYDAGADATARVYRVLNQLLTGTLVVVAIIWLGLGWRAGLIIAMMMPASLAIVPWLYKQIDFSLNPVSIAAMILAIGVLSDDAVVLLENIARRYRIAGEKSRALTIDAINEVGNPTILADLLIVVTLLPTAYITGEMGQYVRSIPIGASAAVMFSLLIALLISPYFGFRLLKLPPQAKKGADLQSQSNTAAEGVSPNSGQKTSMSVTLYSTIMRPLLGQGSSMRWCMYLTLLVLLGASFLLPAMRMIQIGLTPLLDRETFAINIELPAGKTRQESLEVVSSLHRKLKSYPEIKSLSSYIGTSAPPIFPPSEIPDPVAQSGPHRAVIHVQMLPEAERDRLSYEVSQEINSLLGDWLKPYNGWGHIGRIPSGPSSDRDITAEIYGADVNARQHTATQLEHWLRHRAGVMGTEQIPRAPLRNLTLRLDPQRAALHGVNPDTFVRTLNLALNGEQIGTWPDPAARSAIPVILRLDEKQRQDRTALTDLYVASETATAVSLADLVEFKYSDGLPALQRRDLRPVLTVAADLHRDIALPLSVQLESLVQGNTIDAGGSDIPVYWLDIPKQREISSTDGTVVYWSGEWEMTRDVYRDLGVASVVAMLLIYILIAGWFSSYTLPLLIMLPIPLIFIGVLPAHWIWGVDISGIGVLGLISLAGIVTRNAILLVDFVIQREKEGMEIGAAVLQSGIERTRPILLTAATVMFGSGILIFEPALEPLGLSLASGVLISTPITLVLIPVLYFHVYRKRWGKK